MPVRKRLTDEIIVDLPVRKKRYLVWDTVVPSLAVRVGTKRKTFVLVTRFNAHTARKSVGVCGRIVVDVARQRARRLLTQLEGEVDTTLTFGEVLDKLIETLPGRRYPDELDRVLRRDVASWMSKPISSITRKEVIAALDARRSKRSKRKHGTPTTVSAAHHLLSYARRVFNFAVDRDLISHAPTDRLRSTKILGAKAIRTRVLTDDELRKVWNGTEALSPEYRDCIRLLMLTGCRRSEIAAIRRNEVKVLSKAIVLSGDRTKSAAVHTVPLAPYAFSIVMDRMVCASGEDDDCIWHRELRGFGRATKNLHKAIGKIDHFTLHDLRRTFRTRLSALGVSDTVAELAIAHARKGLQRVYDQHAYASELRDAFERWDRELTRILAQQPEALKLLPSQGTTEQRSYPGLAQDLPASGLSPSL